MAAGVLLGAEVTARRNARFGVSRDDTQRMVMWLVVAGLIGARVTWVLSNLSELHSPIDVIAVWKGGMQFSGGFIAALAITPWVTRGMTAVTDRRALFDSAALGLAVGQLIGRIGCISVGEHLGGETHFFLGWTYQGGVSREGSLIPGHTYHNAALYEFLWLLPLIAFLWWRSRSPRFSGEVMVLFMLCYAVLRGTTDFVRAYDQRVWGLTGAQFSCVALLVGGAVLWRKFREEPRKEPIADDIGG